MAGGDQYGYLHQSRKQFRPCDEGGCEWWNEPREFSRWEAWQDMIQAAAYRPHRRPLGDGIAVDLERGETPPRSVRYLARRWGWSKKRVETFIRAAHERGRLKRHQSSAKGDTYLVVNYEVYQPEGDSEGTAKGTAKGTARGQRGDKVEVRRSKEKKSTTPPTPPSGAGAPVWRELPESIDTPYVTAALAMYDRHRRQKRQKMTAEAWRRLLAKLSKWGAERSIRAIEHSVEKGWTGVFEPDSPNGASTVANHGAYGTGHDSREDFK